MGGEGGFRVQMNDLHGQIAEASRKIAKLSLLHDKAVKDGNSELANVFKKRLSALAESKWKLNNRLAKLRGRMIEAKRGRAKHHKRLPGERTPLFQRKMRR